MSEGTGPSEPAVIKQKASMTHMIVTIVAALGLGGGGYAHLGSVQEKIVEGNKAEIASVKEDVQASRDTLTTLKVEVSTIKSQNQSLENKVDELIHLEGRVISLQSKLDSAIKDLETLTRDFKNNQQKEALSALQLDFQQKLSEISDRITRLETSTSGD